MTPQNITRVDCKLQLDAVLLINSFPRQDCVHQIHPILHLPQHAKGSWANCFHTAFFSASPNLRSFLWWNKEVYLVESCKDLVALEKKEFAGQRVSLVFCWLFEGSNLQPQRWPGVGDSCSVEEAQEAQAACRSIGVWAQGFWELPCLEGAPNSRAVPSTATHRCCTDPEIRGISQEEVPVGALVFWIAK